MKIKDKKEINIPKTILYSSWSYAILIFLFVNAIFYTRDTFVVSELEIESICFGGVIILMMIREFISLLGDCTFFSYKNNKKFKTEKEGKSK